MTEHRATLLIFTRGARRERSRRRLLPERLGAVELALHRACLERALAAGRAAGCRLEVSSPEPLTDLGPGVRQNAQRGAGFGERLRRAIDEAGRRATGPLVVVGTDVPGLTAEHIERALAGVREDPRRVVLGPSPDGGFYLLAAARPLARALAAVRWRRGDTLATLRTALHAAGRPVTLLSPLRDLDRRTDLERWLKEGRGVTAVWRGLMHLLAGLLAELRRPRALGHPAWAGPTLADPHLGRAPPG